MVSATSSSYILLLRRRVAIAVAMMRLTRSKLAPNLTSWEHICVNISVGLSCPDRPYQLIELAGSYTLA